MTSFASGLLAFALVMALGFAAHRASLCTVKAVAETLTSGTAHMLASFAKAVLWTVAVSGLLFLLMPQPASSILERTPYGIALAGGFVFGVAAVINGGCSLSTLQRLADGELTMLATLAGFCLGVLGWSALDSHYGLTHAGTLPPPWASLGAWTLPLLVLVWLWAARELAGLWRRRNPHASWRERVTARIYPLSGAALVLGLSSGILYSVQGAWSYTNFLRSAAAASWSEGGAPTPFHGVLFLALLGGMAASSRQRGSLALRWEGAAAGLRRFLAGLMMGAGAAVIPGGNDTLILAAIPSLSPWALGIYLALLAGVATALLAMRRMGGMLTRVECASDRCMSS